MEIEKRDIPPEVRFYIVALDAAGHKQVDIVDMVSEKFPTTVSQSAVSKIISKYKEEGKVEDRARCGRHKKLSEDQELAMVKAVEKDRTLTASRVFRDKKLNHPGPSHVSARTISRTLNDHGLIDSTDLVAHVSEDCVELRLLFALKCQKKQLKWEKVIFTDESDLFPDKQGKFHYRRYIGERVDLDVGPICVHDKRKVKVFGSISYDGVGTIIRYNDTVKWDVFLGFLRTVLADFPLLRGTNSREGKYILQRDNASAHDAPDIRKFLGENNIRTLLWPPNSPDLSIIENVWGYIKEELFKKNDELKTADQTWDEIKKIWYHKVKYILKNLYSDLLIVFKLL